MRHPQMAHSFAKNGRPAKAEFDRGADDVLVQQEARGCAHPLDQLGEDPQDRLGPSSGVTLNAVAAISSIRYIANP
jgi:hypothetical protein